MTANTDYFDAAIRHQIGIRRLSAGEVNRVLALMEKADRELVLKIRERLTRLGSVEDFTSRRLALLLADVRDARAEMIRQVRRQTTGTLLELSGMEVDFEQRLIQTSVPIELRFAAVDAAVLREIVFRRPYQGRLLREWFQSLAAADRRNLTTALQLGLAQGESVQQIVRRVAGTRANNFRDGALAVTRRNAEAVVRTSINHVSNASREALWDANEDMIAAVRWTATLDGRTSAVCRGRDGKLAPIGGKDLPEGSEPLVPPGARPPAHVNALAAGTRVHTEHGDVPIEEVTVGTKVLTHRGRMRPVYCAMAKTRHEGYVFRIETNSGRVLLATDEHPILTHGSGWKRADQIKVGDQLFEDGQHPSGIELPTCVVSKADDYPSPFDEPLVPYSVTFLPGSMAPAVNFEHNTDLREGEVDDQVLDDVLELCAVSEELKERCFGDGHLSSQSSGQSVTDTGLDLRIGSGIVGLHSLAVSSEQVAGLLGLSEVGMVSTREVDLVLISEGCSLPLRPDGDIVFSAPVPKSGVVDPEILGDSPDGLLATDVSFGNDFPEIDFIQHEWLLSKVISVEIVPYTSTVYNLAVQEDETYVAEGMVVHNCRSVMVAVLDGEGILGTRPTVISTKTRRRREIDFRRMAREQGRPIQEIRREWAQENIGAVPASTSYDQFLKRQPAGFQDEVLGQTKGRLFRQGDLEMDQFIDRRGNELTLAQLADTEPEAFVAANLDPDEF